MEPADVRAEAVCLGAALKVTGVVSASTAETISAVVATPARTSNRRRMGAYDIHSPKELNMTGLRNLGLAIAAVVLWGAACR